MTYAKLIRHFAEIISCIDNSSIECYMFFLVALNKVFELLLVHVQKFVDFFELRLEKLLCLVNPLIEKLSQLCALVLVLLC